MITYSATMATWTQLKEGIQTVKNQLASSGTITAEVIGNVLTYLAVITDLGSKMEADQYKITTQIAIDFGEVKEKVSTQQGAIDVLASGGGQRGAHRGSMQGILENKSVGNLPVLGSDKNSFRHWNDRLVNVVANVRPGTRKLFECMMEYVDRENEGDFEELFKASQACADMESAGTMYARIDEDLYTLLMDRTEGEAALRVRGCRPGDWGRL